MIIDPSPIRTVCKRASSLSLPPPYIVVSPEAIASSICCGQIQCTWTKYWSLAASKCILINKHIALCILYLFLMHALIVPLLYSTKKLYGCMPRHMHVQAASCDNHAFPCNRFSGHLSTKIRASKSIYIKATSDFSLEVAG